MTGPPGVEVGKDQDEPFVATGVIGVENKDDAFRAPRFLAAPSPLSHRAKTSNFLG